MGVEILIVYVAVIIAMPILMLYAAAISVRRLDQLVRTSKLSRATAGLIGIILSLFGMMTLLFLWSAGSSFPH